MLCRLATAHFCILHFALCTLHGAKRVRSVALRPRAFARGSPDQSRAGVRLRRDVRELLAGAVPLWAAVVAASRTLVPRPGAHECLFHTRGPGGRVLAELCPGFDNSTALAWTCAMWSVASTASYQDRSGSWPSGRPI